MWTPAWPPGPQSPPWLAGMDRVDEKYRRLRLIFRFSRLALLTRRVLRGGRRRATTCRDGLNQAVQKAFTRPIPKSAGAQMRYLVKQLKSTEAAAAALGITQRTVERYVKDQIKKPRPELDDHIEREVKKGH